MDILDSLGIETESLSETKEKLKEEADNIGMKVNTAKEKVLSSDKLFYGLTNKDRDQAVYEFIVPKAYKDASFNKERIKENIREQYQKNNKLYKVYKFDKYVGICEEILSTMRMKMLPSCSYIIGAPNGFGKTSFVNECLMTLKHQGYNVVPYISLLELAQIRVADERRINKSYSRFESYNGRILYNEPNAMDGKYVKVPEIVTGRFSYSEYINADCLFVSFSSIVSKEIESQTLYQLLSIRGSKGLPTIAMISTSLEPYENDPNLKEYIWDEIKIYKEKENCFDRVYHVSCYKHKNIGLDNKNEKVEADTGIVS